LYVQYEHQSDKSEEYTETTQNAETENGLMRSCS